MMVSANSAICVSAEPMVAGPKRLRKHLHLQIEPRPAQPRQRALPPGIAADQDNLQHAGDQHAPRRGMARGRKERGKRQRHHHRQVEQDRRGGRRREAAERVEDAAVERDQADQQQIGKRDAGELGRQREPARVRVEARRQQTDHRRHEQRARPRAARPGTASNSVKIRSANSCDGSVPLASRMRA